MIDAAVVGSGPNGLAAAIHLARAGLSVRVFEAEPTIGGGVRSAELTLPGYVHDVCSAVHPFAVLSPFFRTLPLAKHGLEWIQPEVMIAHPLDDGSAVAVTADLDETARGLGADAERYRHLIGPLAHDLPWLADDLLAPILRVPHHPLMLARFGLHGTLAASVLAGSFEDVRTRALFAGCAAHSFRSLDTPMTAAFALLFTACAHTYGWPIPRGGSRNIANALASILRSYGGEVVTQAPIRTAPDARAVLYDTSPETLGLRVPRGPGIFKVDYALSEPVPWLAEACRRAGTVHIGGRFEEIAESETAVVRGVHAERPFVLVTQPSLFDATRGGHTLWAYCHVPNGSVADMTKRIEAQISRFAPGFRDVIRARAVMNTHDMEAHNANYVGGDIAGGVLSPLSMLPYTTPMKGIYLCSASTAPGAGVHGMCGYHAAEAALRKTFGIKRDSEAPPASAAE